MDFLHIFQCLTYKVFSKTCCEPSCIINCVSSGENLEHGAINGCFDCRLCYREPCGD
jgi:hypothetical protein